MSPAKTAPEDDPPVSEADPTPRAALPDDDDDDDAPLDRRLVEYATLGFPTLVLLGTALAGWVLGPPAAVLVLAGGALVGVIALFWSSLRTLVGETPLSGADAYALGAPRAEEEQKQAVLRALKDLEFERSVGKISDEDYRELVAKYRAEAKRLLRVLDEEAQPRRQHVEALVAKRLRRAGLADAAVAGAAGAADPADAADAEAEDAAAKDADADAEEGEEAAAVEEAPRVRRTPRRRPKDEAPRADVAAREDGAGDDEEAREDEGAPVDEADGAGPARRACAACGTMNDEDAVFCKKCGARQAQAAAEDDSDEDQDQGEGDDSQARAPREAT
jgi:hypothetical protein